MNTYHDNAFFTGLLEEIKSFNSIVLFHHKMGDGDALGSCYGLKSYLHQLFPEKEVVICSDNSYVNRVFEFVPPVLDETIRSSLAIVLDTANQERVCDERYQLAQRSIKIDHHLFVTKYCDREYIDQHYSSTCEILTHWIYSLNLVDPTMETAKYLLAGMMTDTVGFSTPSVTPRTLFLASYLSETGAKISDLSNDLLVQTKQEFEYVTKLRQHYHTIQQLAYVYVSQEMVKEYHLTVSQAKQYVNVFKALEGINIWCILVENEQGSYDISIRSRFTSINDIARNYQGGGHALASAAKNLSYAMTQALLKELEERSLLTD